MRDCWFDPWWTAEGEPLRGLVADIQSILASNETRDRSRKPQDQIAWESTTEALITNLARSVLEPSPSGAIALPLAKARSSKSRYAPNNISAKTLRKILEALDGEFLDLTVGELRGRASTLTPTRSFATDVFARGVSVSDFARRSGEELIILSTKKRENVMGGISAPPREWSQRVEYRDTPQTRNFREEMNTLNAFLAEADLGFEDDGGTPVYISERRLKRHFTLLPHQTTPRFDQGGRLFGAFWSNLERTRRRSSLRINGQRILEVDYNAMFPRLAHARLGLVLNDTGGRAAIDPYNVPGFEKHRAGLKKALNALFFKPDLTRWPSDIGPELPPKCNVAETKAAILSHMPGLETFFEVCLANEVADAKKAPPGYGLMFTESTILIKALRMLMATNVTALPLHDAVLVAESDAEKAREALEVAALGVAGVRVPVHVKEP